MLLNFPFRVLERPPVLDNVPFSLMLAIAFKFPPLRPTVLSLSEAESDPDVAAEASFFFRRRAIRARSLLDRLSPSLSDIITARSLSLVLVYFFAGKHKDCSGV